MTMPLNSIVRPVVIQVLLLNDDDSTYFDLTPYVEGVYPQFADALQANQCDFKIANPKGYFDKYGGSDKLIEGRKIRVSKGFYDRVTRVPTLYPAFMGKISSVVPSYARTSMDEISFTAYDYMKGLLRQKVTTQQWVNTKYNIISADVLKQYASITNLNLFPLDYPASGDTTITQFPDMTVGDIMKTMYDVVLFSAYFDYSGAFTTRPRLGSHTATSYQILGYPDATDPPIGNAIVASVSVPSASETLVDSGVVLPPFQGFVLTASGAVRFGSGPNFTTYPEGCYESPLSSGLHPPRPDGSEDLTKVDMNLGGGTAAAPTLRTQSMAVVVVTDGVMPTLPIGSGDAIQGDRVLIVNASDSRLPAGGGRIWIIQNDGIGQHGDNSGSWSVDISYGPDFVFEDDNLISVIGGEWQDYEFTNQYRVLGVDIGQNLALGPTQLLANLNDPENMGFEAPRDGKPARLFFYQQTGNSNHTTAQNIYLKVYYNGNPNTFQYMSFSSLTTADGPVISPGPYEDPGSISHGTTWPSIKISKSDGRQEGGIVMKPPTPQYVDVVIYANSDGGGFNYAIEVYGQPVNTSDLTLTSIVDYNTQLITGETLTDIFSDHQTFQTSKSPLAMSTPVTVYLDGVSQGTSSADGLDVTDEFGVDWERGRVVLTNLTYREFVADELFTGGTAVTNSNTINTTFAVQPAPLSVYNSYRRNANGQSFTYTLSGLDVGRGYLVRLHFNEPSATASGQRVFDLYVNSGLQTTLDIYSQSGGKNRAFIYEIDGAVADINGNLTLQFYSDPTKSQTGEPMVCGVEVLLPQGQGGPLYGINSGGSAVIPGHIPVVTADFGWSANQQQYTIQNQEINNALLRNVVQTKSVAQYFLNMSAWQRNKVSIQTASIPTLYPTMLVKFFHRKLGTFGSDVWMYVQAIRRSVERTGNEDGYDDNDTYDGYVLFIKARSS